MGLGKKKEPCYALSRLLIPDVAEEGFILASITFLRLLEYVGRNEARTTAYMDSSNQCLNVVHAGDLYSECFNSDWNEVLDLSEVDYR